MFTLTPVGVAMTLTIELDREEDGRWIAEVRELPGVMVYGGTEGAALRAAEALAFRVLAQRLETEPESEPVGTVAFVPTAA